MPQERLIKRYTNRKLYDTQQSRYVTLEDIARLVREGEDVRVIDNDTSDDLTAITFAQIILDEEKRKTHVVSVPFLRKLIHSGEATVQDISDRATRGIEAIGEFTGRAGERVLDVVGEGGRAVGEGRALVEQLLQLPQKGIDEFVDRVRSSSTIQGEIDRVESTINALEELVQRLRGAKQDRDHGAEDDAGNEAASRYSDGGAQPAPEVDIAAASEDLGATVADGASGVVADADETAATTDSAFRTAGSPVDAEGTEADSQSASSQSAPSQGAEPVSESVSEPLRKSY